MKLSRRGRANHRRGEPWPLRFAAVIVISAAVLASGLTVVALFRPSVFEQHLRVLCSTPVRCDPIALANARARARSDARSSELKIAAGIAALAAGLLAWGRLELSKAEHLSARYSQAIDQLGSQSSDVRLGGIYSLDGLARTSRDDRATIAAVLCAFVRDHTGSPALDMTVAPSTEIQAALDVLCRQADRAWPNPLDLSGANLSRGNLIGANLSGANLSGANLERANLASASLANANLGQVNFTDALLMFADLTDADFIFASLVRANLTEANTLGADFESADLTDVVGFRLP